MKKSVFILLLVMFSLFVILTGCGSGDNAPEISEDISSEPPLSEIEIQQLYSDPDAFKNREVTLTGVVFATVERDQDGVYFQMHQDILNYDNNTIVAYLDPDFVIDDGDYIKLTGTVDGKFEGENAFGATISAPRIIATELKVIDYIEAVVPTIKEITVGQTQEQYGYQVTVEKVEFAKTETRVYVTVNNAGSSSFSLYDFNSILIQDSSQYDSQSNYEADYPSIQTDLHPGVQTKGVICFPAINADTGFTLILEGTSDNYFDESFEPYEFLID